MVIENIIQTIMNLNWKIQTNNNCTEIGYDTHTIIRFRLCNVYKKKLCQYITANGNFWYVFTSKQS